MNQYRIRSTGQLVTDSEFRAMYPNTSFPAVIDADTLSAFGADPVLEGQQAVPADIYHYSRLDGVEQVNGLWMTKYILGPVFTDITLPDGTVSTATDQEAAYRVGIDDQLKSANKQTASTLLADTDYLTLPDTSSHIDNMSEILAYREALRAIAVNPPVSVTAWPVKPATVWSLPANV